MKDLSSLNFVIVGIVKDSAKTLLKDVTRIIQCLQEAKSIKWFIVESNSKDNTVEILDQLASMVPNFSYKCLDHSSRANNCRTIALAEARNMYLSEIRINPSFFEADYVVVMDFNGLNNQINKASFQSCFEYNFGTCALQIRMGRTMTSGHCDTNCGHLMIAGKVINFSGSI